MESKTCTHQPKPQVTNTEDFKIGLRRDTTERTQEKRHMEYAF